MHLKKLKQILGPDTGRYLYPCIRDLLTNARYSGRFLQEDYSGPSRQDITQYIAAWFRHIGISADDCRDWMIGYCVEVLSAISSSSDCAIRHSTKSNIKYIYKSEVAFDCGCEKNVIKASCDQDCPVYNKMLNKYKKRKEREANWSYEPIRIPKQDEPEIELRSVKEIYRDQFEKALEIIKENVKKGVSKKRILLLLNEQGFKTRTGKKWTLAILYLELKKHK